MSATEIMDRASAKAHGTEARIVLGAEHAYVTVTEQNPPASADYALPHGCGARDGLQRLIDEETERMGRMAARILRMQRALAVLPQ